MTREEQIRQAWRKTPINSFSFEEFELGAKWADENPAKATIVEAITLTISECQRVGASSANIASIYDKYFEEGGKK